MINFKQLNNGYMKIYNSNSRKEIYLKAMQVIFDDADGSLTIPDALRSVVIKYMNVPSNVTTIHFPEGLVFKIGDKPPKYGDKQSRLNALAFCIALCDNPL